MHVAMNLEAAAGLGVLPDDSYNKLNIVNNWGSGLQTSY